LKGSAEPRLPEFLTLVDAATRRLPDWIATLADPDRLPSMAKAWQRQQLAREAPYQQPWSHAVMRALELEGLPGRSGLQIRWLAARLGTRPNEILSALQTLLQTGQVERRRGRYRLVERQAVDTGLDPVRGQVKAAWSRTAVDRLEAGSAGNFGYSLFAISRADLVQLRELHLQYVRAMQDLIAKSEPNECVGLYCSQLLDLATEHNALAVR
jgi:DNA-binding transcriptional regulator YhcF (GntR family)